MFLPPVTTPRRRGRRWLAITAACMAIVLLAGFIWASTIDPLGSGSYGFTPRWPDGDTMRDVYDADPADGTAYTLYIGAERIGSPLSYAFSIRNDGPVGITIRSIGGPDPEGAVVSTRVVGADVEPLRGTVSSELPGPGVDGAVVPFAPFTLEPAEEAIVYMEAVVHTCNARGATQTLASVAVGYSVLGVPRSTRFVPNLQIAFRGAGCSSA
jgi:hypothetical protein